MLELVGNDIQRRLQAAYDRNDSGIDVAETMKADCHSNTRNGDYATHFSKLLFNNGDNTEKDGIK